jgi:hypothetical protein
MYNLLGINAVFGWHSYQEVESFMLAFCCEICSPAVISILVGALPLSVSKTACLWYT